MAEIEQVELTDKQRAFVEEYLKDFNATQAAIRAKYSEESARQIGSENLSKPYIAELIRQRIEETAMSADEVLIRLAEQARGIPAQYISTKGTVKIAQLVRDGKTHLIKKIADTAQGRTYEFYDAQSALQLIGRHHALFTDKTENKTDATIETTVKHDLSKLSADELRAMRDMVSKLEHEDTDA